MKKFLRITAIVVLIILTLSVGLGGTLYALTVSGTEFDVTKLTAAGETLSVTAADGGYITGYENAPKIRADSVPQRLAEAFIAVEDKRFYKHKGVDMIRMCGAIVSNLKTQSYSEGASTISQQLIKNTHLSQEKTLTRKLKEIKLARQMEKQLDKNEILADYLNVIYFGGGVYGAAEAAEVFFGKTATDLTYAECATLAAVVKNPSKYAPKADASALKERRNLVLKLMLEQNKINADVFSAATTAPLNIIANTGSYAKSYVRSALTEAAQILGMTEAELRLSGLNIVTYYDDEQTKLLVDTLNNETLMTMNDKGEYPSRAAILADNTTLGVTAYYNTEDSGVQSIKRQLGSTIKPLLVYSPALDNGTINPATPILDERTDFGGYAPSNYGDAYYGKTNIAVAVQKSLNVPAVRVLNDIGVVTAMQYAEKLGITLTPEDENLSLALGGTTYGNTLIELAGGYSCLANDGIYGGLSFIKSIKDGDKTIYTHAPVLNRVFDSETAYLMTSMLTETAESGTARSLKGVNADVAAKTGTVSLNGGNRDAYVACYTTEHTICVWHGAETGFIADTETGGAYTTKSASTVLNALYETPPKKFSKPNSIVNVALDKIALEDDKLLLATDNTPLEYVVYAEFSEKYVPYEYAATFTDLSVEELSSVSSDSSLTISFTAKPYLCYEVIREGFWGSDVLFTVTKQEEKVNLSINKTPLDFLVRYSATAYYMTDDGERISGTPVYISS